MFLRISTPNKQSQNIEMGSSVSELSVRKLMLTLLLQSKGESRQTDLIWVLLSCFDDQEVKGANGQQAVPENEKATVWVDDVPVLLFLFDF